MSVRPGRASAIVALALALTAWASAVEAQPDTTPPTATINQASGQADPTTTGPIFFTLVFSEPITGLQDSDITVTGSAGATAAVTSGNGVTFTVTVTNMTQYGTVVVQLNAGVVTDLAGNLNFAAGSTDNVVTYAPPPDTIPPTVTVNQAVGQNDPASADPIRFTVVFSEQIFGFSTTDLTITSAAGALIPLITNAGANTYTVSLYGMSTNGAVSLSIAAGRVADAAGNSNTASTSVDNTVTFVSGGDTTPPTLTINQAPGQADPTTTSPLRFSAVFSELVAGFSPGDVVVGGTAGATSVTITGTSPNYTVEVAGMTQSGTVIVSVGAGAVNDIAGNPNVASTSTDNQVTFTFTTTLMPPVNFETYRVSGTSVTFRWNAPASGPSPTGFLLEGGLAPGAVQGTVPIGDVPQYTLSLPSGVFYLRLRSLGPGGPSAPSDEVQVFVGVPAPPSPPVQFMGTANGSALELSWRNTFAGGTPTAVALDVSGAATASLVIGNVEQFSYPAMPGGTYTFRVRALQGALSSALSTPVTLTFPGSCTVAPGAPSTVAWVEGNVVTVRWDPPASGGAATSYALTVSGAYVGAFPLGSARTLSSPVPPGIYTFRVTAYNSCGPSQASAPAVVVVP